MGFKKKSKIVQSSSECLDIYKRYSSKITSKFFVLFELFFGGGWFD